MPTVTRSAVIDAPVATVWALLRDFNAHRDWHPAIAESTIEGFLPPDQVGCVRSFRLRDGGALREQLLALSDRDRALRYCILSGTVPLLDYVATILLRPITDTGRTFWTWEGRFRAPAAEETRLVQLVGSGVYEAGFEGARRYLGSVPASRPFAPVPAGEADAIVMSAHGGADVLTWRNWPVPAPGPGEIRIRHTAIGVNFIDIYARTGQFRLVDPPGIPGMEAAGTVVAAGPGVTRFAPGDRVGYACLPPGAYATERTMRADLVLRLPDTLGDEQAAAVLLKGMAASFLLHEVHPLRAGETVLVHAAAGGTGLLLCQWAAALGATVIGVVGSAEKERVALAHGAAHVIRSGADFSERVRALTGGRGVDVAFDGVGGAMFLRSYEALAERGHLVSFGQASGPIPPVDVAGFAAKSARVSRPNFGHYTGTPAQAARVSARLFDALAAGLLRVPEPTRVPLREAAMVHRALEARATTGATVLIPQ